MNKRKTPKSLQKPLPIVETSNSNADNLIQFELELCWCIQQLEQSLSSGKLSQKIADETSRNIKTLKSSSVPLIRKRQLMKTVFGDYRSKMKEEEKKLSMAAKEVKFTTNTTPNPKFNFVKKSAILSSGKDFRFNFDPKTNIVNTEIMNNGSRPITLGSNDLKLGEDFRFNFKIEEDNDLNLNGLTIKS